jgi:hypothetical protein
VLPITVFRTNGRSLTLLLFGLIFDPRVAAMLAEIFMVRLEAERRLVQELPPPSTSLFIPLGPENQFAAVKTEPKGADGSNEERPLTVAG